MLPAAITQLHHALAIVLTTDAWAITS